MTTIAWKKGVLAVDKQCTSGNLSHKMVSKIVETESYIYVVAGAVAEAMVFIHHLVNDGSPFDEEIAPYRSATQVIRMDKKTGELLEFEQGVPMEVSGDVMVAWGSGRDLAMGAMAMGASPKEAVDVASGWDIYTGFGVDVYVSEKARRAQARKEAKRQKMADR